MESKEIQLLSIDESQQIESAEQKLLSIPKEFHVECPVEHKFGPGTYIRQVTIPANTVAIGHYQNFEHVNIFVKGKVLMKNLDGTTTLLTAPMTFIGKPGRKIGYIIEDMVWINAYPNPNNETDIEKIENYFVTKSDVFLDHQEKNRIDTFKEDLKEITVNEEKQGE